MSAKDGIAKTNGNFVAAYNAGDAAGVAACYTEDGCFMIPGVPTVRGREALAAAFDGLMGSGVNRVELTTAELLELGDTAIEVGEYKLFAGDNLADHGRFMVAWRQVDGNWYLHRDIINTLQAQV